MMKKLGAEYRSLIILSGVAIIMGILVGAMDALFASVLLLVSHLRDQYLYFVLPGLPFIGMFIIWYYTNFGKESIQGMSLIFETGHGMREALPFRMIPMVMVGTWLSHLFGASVGREGVAVQIGGTLSYELGKRLPLKENKRIFLMMGMAAGFGGVFRTPFAGTLFALEVLAPGTIAYEALLPSLVAALCASATSGMLGLKGFTYAFKGSVSLDLNTLITLVIAGILFGLIGALFAYGEKQAKGFFQRKIENPYKRIAFLGVIIMAFMYLTNGRYSGLGSNLITMSFDGHTIYVWDFIVKLALTLLSLAAGYQGGEVTPLFSIGATAGFVLSLFLPMSAVLLSALGYAAVFGGATNTLLAPILIGGEVFGFSHLPYFLIVCVLAFVVNHNLSIYTKQKTRSVLDESCE